jgi:hypothetical protein
MKKWKNEAYSVSFSAITDMNISTKAKKILICVYKDTIAEVTRLAHCNKRPIITKCGLQTALRLPAEEM